MLGAERSRGEVDGVLRGAVDSFGDRSLKFGTPFADDAVRTTMTRLRRLGRFPV
jgi:hypothetical protein